MRTRWMLAMVAVMALFVAACGGDSDGDDAAPQTSTDTTEAGSETTQTTEAPEAPEGTSAPKEADFGDADPNSTWCELADDVQTRLDAVEADPFAFFSEEGIQTINAALDQAVQVAPAEIRSDVAASRDAFAEIGALLERYDYDLLSIPESELAAIDPSASEAAADRIEAFNEQVCGIESDGGVDAAPPADGGDGEAPVVGDADAAVEQFVELLTATLPITDEQARCLANELDLGSLAAGGELNPNDPELLDQLFGVLGECNISVADLTG